MRCPHCNGEINEQADSDLFSPLGMGSDKASEGEVDSRGRVGSRQTKRRTQLSPGWFPSPAQQLYCEQQGKDPEAMAKAFKEYYAAKGTVWKDWNLVWMKACREWEAPKLKRHYEPLLSLDAELNLWKQRLSSKFWSPWWGPRVGEPGCMVPKILLNGG